MCREFEIKQKKINLLVIILLRIAVIENRYFVVTEQIGIFIHFDFCIVFFFKLNPAIFVF